MKISSKREKKKFREICFLRYVDISVTSSVVLSYNSFLKCYENENYLTILKKVGNRVARKKLRNLELSKQKYHTVILCNKKLVNKKMFSSNETINFKAIFLDTYETFKLKK